MNGYDKLPAPWRGWLKALDVQPPPVETRANCARCVMCAEEDWTATRPESRYRPDTRCCTYLPSLWNFQVGGMLVDPETPASAREALEARLASGLGSPLGVASAFEGDDRYHEMVAANGFGRSLAVRCPYFQPETGACGAWRYRNAVCATWYCRHDRGMIGLGYWSAIRRLIELMEVALGHRVMNALMPESDGQSWDGWDGTRVAYFKAAWQLAAGLDPAVVLQDHPAEIERILMFIRAGERSHDDLRLPEKAAFKDVTLVEELGPRVRVSGYSSNDTMLLPTTVFKALEQFDGRPIAEVREALADIGIHTDDVMVRRLIDLDILR